MPLYSGKIILLLNTRKVIIVITILAFLVFGNMLLNDFVWDDKTFIILNPDIHNPILPFLFGRNMFNDLVYYRPIPAIYFSIFYTLSPNNVFIWHFFQLALHILNTVLLYKLFRHFFHNINSFFLSLIFLVHPMQVESVSYIAQTVSPLFFLFGISALLTAVKKKVTGLHSVIISFLLLISLLTKETGIIFVILVAIYSFLYKKKEKMWVLLGSTLSICIYFLMRFGMGHVFFEQSTLIAPIARASLSVRLLSVPQVVFYYLKTFVYPEVLGIDQHWIVSSPTLTTFLFPIAVEILLGIGVIALGRYLFKVQKTFFRTYLFFGVWFLVSLFFHSQIVPLDMTVADRWFYATLVGLLGFIGIIIEILFSNKSTKKILIGLSLVIILALSVRTIIRNRDWVNAVTLYTHDLKSDDNFDIENSLSWEYIQQGKYNLATFHAKKSIEFWPEWDKNWYNLGVIYHFQGNISGAEKSYTTALAHNSENAQVIENLGYLLLFYENQKRAHEILLPATVKFPQRPKLWFYLALADYKLGNKTAALEEARRAYILNPEDPNLSSVYTSLQKNLPITFK